MKVWSLSSCRMGMEARRNGLQNNALLSNICNVGILKGLHCCLRLFLGTHDDGRDEFLLPIDPKE